MPNRLEPVPIEEIEDPDLRELAEATRDQAGDVLFLPAVGTRIPEVMKSFYTFYQELFSEGGPVDLSTLELMRIKCYDVNECRL